MTIVPLLHLVREPSFTSPTITGLLSYAVFKRYEPQSPLALFLLLLLLPVGAASILAGATVYAIVAFCFVYYATLSISVVSYRLSPFHPLAKYPGPLAARVTKLWFTHLASDGKQHLHYQRLHELYGDVVRIGPNELSFNDPNVIDPIMGKDGMPKGPFWDGRVRERKNRGIVGMRNAHEHLARRQRWRSAFTTSALKGYELFIEKRASQLADGLEEHLGKPVDLTQWVNRFTFDFMMDMSFDGGSEMLRDGDVNGLWHVIEKAQPDALKLGHLPWLFEYYHRLPWLGTGAKAFSQLVISRVKERLQRGSLNRDIFHYLMGEDSTENRPPLAQVTSDAAVAVLAGSDTTATTLACLFYLLLQHPEIYKRLQAEIDNTTGHMFDSTTNAAMPYLNAVINETLRLYPPVLSGSQRAPEEGSGGSAFGEHFIPEGTSVCVHTYTLQRDPRNFSVPTEFIPERWLSSPPANFVHNTAAFIPFSYGPANCIGKQIAYQEMRAVIRLVLEKFDLAFAPGYDPARWDVEMQDFYVTLKGELPVVIQPRCHSA